MKKNSQARFVYRIVSGLLVLFLFPAVTLAQTTDWTAQVQGSNQDAQNQGAYNNANVAPQAQYNNANVAPQAQYNNASVQPQAGYNNSTVAFPAQQNAQSVSGAAQSANAPINASALQVNTSAKTAGQNANSTINQDIYSKKAFTTVNTDIYTAAQTANSSLKPGASCSNKIKTFGDIFTFAACVINSFLLTIAVTFAVIYFIWGVVRYVLSADSVEERKKSRQVIIWGVISIFVIVSVWGIVAAFRTILGI